ncbi:MAG: hypothetical protein ABFS02_13875 [Pseudomonadota bacterium]
MNYRSVLLFTTAATFYGVSMGVLAVPLPGSVDVTGPDGSMSRWYLSNNNTYEGNVASNGTTIDRYDAFDGHHRLNVEGVFYQDADNDYAVTSNTDGTFIEYDANAGGEQVGEALWLGDPGPPPLLAESQILLCRPCPPCRRIPRR